MTQNQEPGGIHRSHIVEVLREGVPVRCSLTDGQLKALQRISRSPSPGIRLRADELATVVDLVELGVPLDISPPDAKGRRWAVIGGAVRECL